MNEFVRFLLAKTFQPRPLECPDALVKEAFDRTFADVRWHFKQATAESAAAEIRRNGDATPVFLFRLASLAHKQGRKELADAFAWLLKECCACDLYYSNEIGEGFYVGHGVGTVIGSRNKIGKGFQIFQGCTIGHRADFEEGCTIGDNVILFANSSVIGRVTIGDDVIVGAHCLVLSDVPSHSKCYGQAATRVEPRTVKA